MSSSISNSQVRCLPKPEHKVDGTIFYQLHKIEISMMTLPRDAFPEMYA